MFQIFTFLLSGCFTGFLLSAPIGPANILCLENTLKSGVFAGFLTGAGATFGDFLFVIMALAGLIAIGDLQTEHAYFMKYIGSGLLIIFGIFGLLKGISLYHAHNAHESLLSVHTEPNYQSKNYKASVFSGFLTSFILTITNPLTPIGVVSAVTAVGLGGGVLLDNPLLATLLFALGIIIGSLSWWFALTKTASKFAKKLTRRSLSFVNYVGCVLMFSMAGYIFV